jgi:hypothetical protein
VFGSRLGSVDENPVYLKLQNPKITETKHKE